MMTPEPAQQHADEAAGRTAKNAPATLTERLDRAPRSALAIACLALSLLIGVADYLTGYEIGLDLFYLFPIALAAWYLGGDRGVLFAVITMIIMTLSDVLSGKEYTRLSLDIWDAIIRFGFYVIVAVLLSRLRIAMQERQRLIRELQDTLKEVKELRGILPICSSCKKIRTDEGYWQNVDEYLAHHTNAEFSHGLCKECATRLYHQYYDKKGSLRERP